MPILGSCSPPPDPSSAFECPTVNATRAADTAMRSQTVVEMFRFARFGVGKSAWLISALVSYDWNF
eukprot:1362745-Pleurochrysis_carterae.AAC.1